MKMSSSILLIALALAAGAFVPFQTASNTLLSKPLHSGLYASLIVFVVAAISMTIFIIIRQEPLPGLIQMKEVPWFAWFAGGVLGVAYIFLLIYLAPQLGMATVTGFVVGGQLLTAIVIDHYGLMGFPVHAIQWQRLAGVLLLCAGLYLIKKF